MVCNLVTKKGECTFTPHLMATFHTSSLNQSHAELTMNAASAGWQQRTHLLCMCNHGARAQWPDWRDRWAAAAATPCDLKKRKKIQTQHTFTTSCLSRFCQKWPDAEQGASLRWSRSLRKMEEKTYKLCLAVFRALRLA